MRATAAAGLFCATACGAPNPGRGKEWYAYWEDWCNEGTDVTWWDDNTPGHCAGGCVLSKGFFDKAASY
eukprot:gene34583-14579_t